MIVMEDGTKLKAGMSFKKKRGQKTFMIIRTHQDGTVSYAPETDVQKNEWSGVLSASSTVTVRVTGDEFKTSFKELVEDKFTAARLKAEAETAVQVAIEARTPDHDDALWMDLLVRASKGEDVNSLFGELQDKLEVFATEVQYDGR